jgi:hypothetical protein
MAPWSRPTTSARSWFYTELVSASPESKGGACTDCFAAVANDCDEGIAVSKGSSLFGPYNVYFLKANYDPSERGYPYLLNDFAKISATRDAFVLFEALCGYPHKSPYPAGKWMTA